MKNTGSNNSTDNPHYKHLIYDKMRTYLRCGEEFRSTGPEHRICYECRRKASRPKAS